MSSKLNISDVIGGGSTSLQIELDTVRADLVRVETELRLLQNSSKSFDKLKSQYLLLEAELKRERQYRVEIESSFKEAEREMGLLRETVTRERGLLAESTRKRLAAEQEASAARLAEGKLRQELEMLECGIPFSENSDSLLKRCRCAVAEDGHCEDLYGAAASKNMDGSDEEGQALVGPTPMGTMDENGGKAELSPLGNGNQIHVDDDQNRMGSQKRERSEADDDGDEDDDEVVPPTAPCPITPVPQQTTSNSRMENAENEEVLSEQQQQPRTPDSALNAPPRAADAVKPLVMLTGYGGHSGVRVRLQRKLEQLGGAIYLGNDFSDVITHVIKPDDGPPSVKMFAAVLTGKWVVSDSWITASFESGRLLDEREFGWKRADTVPPFSSLTFYLHSSFLDHSEDKVRVAKQLIQLGGGKVIDLESKIHPTYRLVSREHGATKSYDITWVDFLRLIAPNLSESVKKTPVSSAKKKRRALDLSNEGDNNNNANAK